MTGYDVFGWWPHRPLQEVSAMAQDSSRWLGWLGTATLCALVIACGNKRAPAAAPPPPPPPAVVAAPPPAPPPPRASSAPQPKAEAPATLSEEEIFARTSLSDLNAKQPLGDAFFDYDQSNLSEQVRTTLQRDAGWMKKWNRTRVLIEGHADERGTNEYNLALGDRRAAAARDYLVNLGIDSTRISIVSKGKEAPFCTEHNEECWYENRRGHFIITAK
jgi:peptidoglycan-associated lipoprotein